MGRSRHAPFPLSGGVWAAVVWACQPGGCQNNSGCLVSVAIPNQMIELDYR